MSVPELIFAVAAVLGGAYVRGYSGFGSAMLWIASLSLVLPPAQVVPTVFVLDLVGAMHLLPKVWREIHWRSLLWLLAGTLGLIAAGMYVLAALPATPMRISISIVVLAATLLLWRGFRLERLPGRAAAFATGALCGLLGGSTGIGGPPAIWFYFSSPLALASARASIIAFLLGADVLGIGAATAHGLVTSEVLVRSAYLLPAVFVGTALGNRGFIRADPERFRRLVALLLLVLSAAVFVRALYG